MRKVFIIFILGIIHPVFADLVSEHLPTHKTCGSPQLIQQDVASRMDKMKLNDPIQYQALLQENEQLIRFNKINSRQQMFWAYNFTSDEFYTITATLRKNGEMVKIWVEDESWNNNYVNNTTLDVLLSNLEEFSGSSSIDPNKGIVEIDTILFGQPPNYDGDGIIDFLILDILDSFDPTQNSAFIAGYFSPLDQQSSPNSNEMDLMYLDSYPGIYFNGNYKIDPVLSTTAHELQHLIHYNYDQNEELWVNEGLSELAGTYCGYGLDFPALYLEDPNQNLINWEGEVKDYARVNLWTLYCAEQLGLGFIKDLTKNPANGISGFNQAAGNSGNLRDFNSIYSDWVLANLINQTVPNPKYGYTLPEAQDVKIKTTNLVYEYPISINGIVESYGAEYHQFRGKDSLDITFLSAVPENSWVILQGDNYRIRKISGNELSEPNFSQDSTYILVLHSLNNDLIYRYNAFAKFSLRYYEISYDDDQTDLKITFQNQDLPIVAANSFTVPVHNLELESISFWNGSKDHTVQVRVYDQTGNNFPGNDLINPIDKVLTIENSWVDVPLPEPIVGLNQNDIIYVGIQINSSNKSLGYDEQNLPGISYLNPRISGWRPLSDFSIAGNPANGVMMIRAVFSGLMESGSPFPQENELVVENGFPNPFFPDANKVTIQYQKGENPGSATFEVYNSLGQKIAEQREEATGIISWSGRSDSGPLAAGIYFYRITFDDAVTGKRLRSSYQKIVILN